MDKISRERLEGEKIKTPFAQIIVEGHQKSPHYSILYYSPDDKDFRIGYGSYCLDYVFEWLRDEFEIVEDESFSLLFPHTRERVAKVWRGEWEEERFAGELEGWQHTECGRHSTEKSMWCPKCGKAMTEEAVDLVMLRLEALQDEED